MSGFLSCQESRPLFKFKRSCSWFMLRLVSGKTDGASEVRSLENLLLNHGSFLDELSFWKYELLHLVRDPVYLQPEKSAHTFISGEQWHLVSILAETEHSLGSLRLSLLLGLSFFFYYMNFTAPWIWAACAAHLWQGRMDINSKVAVRQYGDGMGWGSGVTLKRGLKHGKQCVGVWPGPDLWQQRNFSGSRVA